MRCARRSRRARSAARARRSTCPCSAAEAACCPASTSTATLPCSTSWTRPTVHTTGTAARRLRLRDRARGVVIVPDVNVLIYAFREDQPDHGRYREWLTAAFAADEPVALPGHVFSGFMRVVSPTRGCSRPPRLPTRLRGTCSSLSAPRRRWARLRVVACSTAADRCGAFRGRLALTPNGGVAVGPVLAPAIEKLPEAIARLVG